MIFFDLDDTLFDFTGSEYLGVITSYSEYGISDILNEQDFYETWCKIRKKHFKYYLTGRYSFGEMQINSIKDVFKVIGIRITDENAKNYFNIYLRNFEANWKSFNDVFLCLERLRGYRLGIISNGDRLQQISKLRKIGILNHFEIIVTSGEVGLAKPNLRIFEIACERSKEKPNKCYYIGDNITTDILASQRAMMKGIWLNRTGKDVNKEVTMISNLNKLDSSILEL